MADKYKHTPEQARKLWVEALRSGKYEQGREYLCADGLYCCLGVACEVMREHEGPKSLKLVLPSPVEYGQTCEMALAPSEVMSWLGLAYPDGRYQGDRPGESSSLTAENDDGKNFVTIAAIIESNPPNLFVKA